MSKDEKMAALGGIMAAVAVSMAFYGGDWLSLLKLLSSPEKNISPPPAQIITTSNPLTEEIISIDCLLPPAAPDVSPISSEKLSFRRRAKPVPRRPDTAPSPTVPAALSPDSSRTSPTPPSVHAVLPPEHAVPQSSPAKSSAMVPPARLFAPYFYRDGELLGRIPEIPAEEPPGESPDRQFQLHRNIRQIGSNLQITLSLTSPSELSSNSAVIFSQKIPEGWIFSRNQGCGGWQMEQQGYVKFLAVPEAPDKPLQISFFFNPQDKNQPLPQPEEATCAIQCSDGNRKFCRAD